jgi:hypothetical protein
MDDHDILISEVKRQRGELISSVVLLEKWIDLYISHHFCSGKKVWELMELIVATNRITFENKLQVFKVLLERHDKSFLDENKSIIKDVIKIIEVRNVFAHYIMFSGKSAIEKYTTASVMTFVKFKNDTTYEEYSIKEVNKYIRQSTDYTAKLRVRIKM